MVREGSGPQAGTVGRVFTEPGPQVPRTERGKLKGVEVSLLIAGGALGFAGPKGRDAPSH